MENITQKMAMIAFLTLGLPAVSSAAPVLLNAVEDSGILDGDSRNDPYPGILYSELDTISADDVFLSVLKFDLTSLAGMTVNSASLELTSISNHNAGAFIHDIFSSSNDSWTEGTVTGLNRPLNSTLTFLDSINISGTSQTYSWNVLTGVTGTDGLTGTNNLLTLLIRPNLSQAGTAFGPHFNDRSSTSGAPLLRIDANPASGTGPTPSVPEPTTIALLALGFLGIGFSRKKMN
ncbi:MAG: hypothetical protein DRQ61_12340 [Gammaproteobacteria bacterium]|nr:MAG: hypothetical protein DRQ61_12340 [Gammaproteobacteria bacterium]RLA20479.1 MAG: hypothetical protein DRQ56_03060 [Gammaproteobacteria bacterium]